MIFAVLEVCFVF